MATFEAMSPDELARAVVDETGRLVELKLREELLSRPAWMVTASVLAAVTAAQDARPPELPPPAAAEPDLTWFDEVVDQARRDGELQMERLRRMADDLVRIVERR
jgi:hypothetical protein